ncbi:MULTISPECIES: J domain-containing protein [Paraburkholderia]|uniref:J domain-containing protein n=1 Tax=Paraburkholderia TaxID=1822464 RepID=UPI0022508909|nr:MULTISPECIES: J domain-containing protein [Paraburkholderia]
MNELLPLTQKMQHLRARMAHLLDEQSNQKRITQTERRTLSAVIVDLAARCLGEEDSEELKALYNRHSGSDYDEERASELDEMKSMLETVLGVELDDIDMNSPDEVLDRLQTHIEQDDAAQAAEHQARQAQSAKKKKTAKQMAAETRREEEEAQLSRSIREVYRKLASALHPDRENDPEERKRKTALMQRVNEAYSKNNLLHLLELQLELEHIDQNALDNLSEDRLKHYNKILKEQVGELDDEIMFVEMAFKERYGLDPMAPITPKKIMHGLTADVFMLQEQIESLEYDLVEFQDLGTLKAWLKIRRRWN